MMKKLLLGFLLIVVFVFIFVFSRTSRYGKQMPKQQSSALPEINDSAIRHMSEAVQIKTISYADSLPIDSAEYTKFRIFIERAYPLIHQQLNRQIFNQFSYLYTWKGSNPSLSPYVIMAHTDVVPVEAVSANKWTVPPFGGIIRDSMIWGRGVVDDKGCVVPILEAAEELLRHHYQPERTIYLSFGHDEEISGIHGAETIAQWFRAQNIHPEMVLDEGGEITEEQFKELKRPIAAIAIAEKGYLSFELSVDKIGGHSSMPESETAIDILAAALVKIRLAQMPFRITAPMDELLHRVAPGLPFSQRMAIANQWMFGGLLQKEFEKNAITNAVFHTTIVPTIFNSGVKDNIIPVIATAIVNCRSLPGDKQEDVIAFMKKQIKDDRVKIRPFKENRDASKVTSTESNAFKRIEEICYKVIPGVLPTPYLLMGGTDSRNFEGISDGIVKFAPTTDAKGYHGIDERLPFLDFKRAIYFYTLLMKGRE